LLELN